MLGSSRKRRARSARRWQRWLAASLCTASFLSGHVLFGEEPNSPAAKKPLQRVSINAVRAADSAVPTAEKAAEKSIPTAEHALATEPVTSSRKTAGQASAVQPAAHVDETATEKLSSTKNKTELKPPPLKLAPTKLAEAKPALTPAPAQAAVPQLTPPPTQATNPLPPILSGKDAPKRPSRLAPNAPAAAPTPVAPVATTQPQSTPPATIQASTRRETTPVAAAPVAPAASKPAPIKPVTELATKESSAPATLPPTTLAPSAPSPWMQDIRQLIDTTPGAKKFTSPPSAPTPSAPIMSAPAAFSAAPVAPAKNTTSSAPAMSAPATYSPANYPSTNYPSTNYPQTNFASRTPAAAPLSTAAQLPRPLSQVAPVAGIDSPSNRHAQFAGGVQSSDTSGNSAPGTGPNDEYDPNADYPETKYTPNTFSGPTNFAPVKPAEPTPANFAPISAPTFNSPAPQATFSNTLPANAIPSNPQPVTSQAASLPSTSLPPSKRFPLAPTSDRTPAQPVASSSAVRAQAFDPANNHETEQPQAFPAPRAPQTRSQPVHFANQPGAPAPKPLNLAPMADPLEGDAMLRANSPFEVIDQTGAVQVMVRRSKLLRTKVDIYRTAVVDDSICDVVQFTPREISLIGKSQGSTHVTFWFDDPNMQPVTYLIQVVPDVAAVQVQENTYKMLQDVINEMFPDSKIQLLLVADKLIIRGQAKDSEEAAQIVALIRSQSGGANGNTNGLGGGFGGGLSEGAAAQVLSDSATGASQRSRLQVINMLRVPGVQQVALRVKIAEMNRSAARGFGVDVKGHINFTDNPDGSQLFLQSMLNVAGGAGPALLTQLDGDDIQVGVRYLQQHGILRLLSEPTLVTMSGTPATFIAGGEFAVPTLVGSAGLNAVTSDFRAFGAIISFMPTVVDKDRIRLQVSPEFSQINSALTVNNTPGLKVRAATTTVEMREGQTLAIAGLLEDNMNGTNVGDLPFLARVFGRRDMTRNETELLILVTPELVQAMEAEEVPPLPGFDVTEPTSAQFFLHGRLEGTPTQDYRSTVWPRLKKRYGAGGPAMTSGPFGHGQ
ncbi:pilus assembly protein N-terminal domain-containing protein [Anatilimnocola sp. NA78]|uniref:type II and III secretion system protein family protein n=1 Tax=Anatilimnocola sp. NA78 TaxID=3415683 RepID=UPI003CE4B989